MVSARCAGAISWDYAVEGGAKIMQNALPRVPATRGEDFCNAVLRVWRGQQPADAELERGLLSA